jgi:bla regulator protein BlaR1
VTAAVALYLLIVSAVCAAAAWAADEGLRRLGGPTRWLWLASLVAPVALLIAPLLVPVGSSTPLAGAFLAPTVELPGLVVGPDSGGWAGLAVAWTAVWVGSSTGLALVLLRGYRRLDRERSGWERTSVLGRDVYLSTDRGPAIAGLLRPWIVLPRWSLRLPEPELSLVVIHEEEHVRAGDATLLALALAALVAAPWNPIAWWQLRRLKMAMEVDCDRRVLRRAPDPARYGQSLITVAGRSTGRTLGLPAFTERSLSLERRIVAMTSRRSRWTAFRAVVLVSFASLVGIQACAVESPVGSDQEASLETVEVPAPPEEVSIGELSDQPTFTPFTVAPSITNRAEVIDAMEREYPPLLREAGVGGTIRVYFFIDAEGRVQDVRIDESSGHRALDDAALAVADMYRFSPALNRNEKVPVWVSFPITFQSSAN